MVVLFFVAIGAIVSAVSGSPSASTPTSNPPAPAPIAAKDDLDLFLKRYGKPDKDDSTLHDNRRPSIVTRVLTYRKENVKALYVYERDGTWKWVGFTDAKSKEAIMPEVVVERHEGATRAFLTERREEVRAGVTRARAGGVRSQGTATSAGPRGTKLPAS